MRDALYMPALVAIKHNPDLKTKYEALRGAGKPAKVAIDRFLLILTCAAPITPALGSANWTEN